MWDQDAHVNTRCRSSSQCLALDTSETEFPLFICVVGPQHDNVRHVIIVSMTTRGGIWRLNSVSFDYKNKKIMIAFDIAILKVTLNVN